MPPEPSSAPPAQAPGKPATTTPGAAARLPGWWWRLRLRDVVVFTLPLALLGAYVFGSAIGDFRLLNQYDDWWSRAAHVPRLGWNRVKAMVTLPRRLQLEHRLAPEAEDAATFRLRVDRTRFWALSNGMPATRGEWLEAELVRGSELHPVEVRFRGDTSVHWTADKKSLTVKTGKRDFYKGHRRFALTLKDVLPQFLVNSLARDFDLLAPETAVAPVYVNDRFHGVYRFVEDVDESFLRRHGNMPGNVFRGDAAERGEYFKNVPRELFLNPYIWDRVAFNDRPGSIGDAALGRWIADLNGGTHADHERFLSWLDLDEMARYVALSMAAGDPYHMSGVHNQLWYEEPSSGKLHPVVWDLRLLPLEPAPQPVNRFLATLLRDPRVMAGALEELHGWLRDDRLLALARERLARPAERYAAELGIDRLRAGAISDVGDAGEALAQLAENLDVLRAWVGDARADAWSGRAPELGPEWLVLDVVVRGRAPLEMKVLGLRGPRAGGGTVELWADADLDGAPGDGDRPLEVADEGTAVRLLRPERLLAGTDTAGPGIGAAPVAYRYFLRVTDAPTDGPPGAAGELRARPYLGNAVTGGGARVGELEPGTVLPEGTTWHPWLRAEPTRRTIELAGEVHLDADLVVAPHETLLLAPGTRLVLAPNVSVLAKGRVLAAGTAAAPVEVVPADPDLPWGAFALQGSGADGSRFRHVRFRRGGGALLERVEYKGMVDVYWARDVSFEGCEFSDNVRCDDAINAVNADVDLLGCAFRDTAADAVDYDFSTGLIRGCSFERVGNDGVDLMSCGPTIADNRLRGAGDKGISVGEESFPLIYRNDVEDCAIGVEVKDFSRPLLAANTLRGCGVGVNAYLKNWRYGAGGWPVLFGNEVLENDRAEALDAASRRTRPRGDAARVLLWEAGLVPDEDGGWRRDPPPAPVADQRFRDGLESVAAGWRGDRLRRLHQRDHDLVVRAGRDGGRAGLGVDWSLEPGSDHVLLLEVATRWLEDARVGVVGADGREPRLVDLPILDDPAEYALVAVPLPPGDHRGLVLELGRGVETPAHPSGEGVLRLHRWTLHALPPGWRAPGEASE